MDKCEPGGAKQFTSHNAIDHDGLVGRVDDLNPAAIAADRTDDEEMVSALTVTVDDRWLIEWPITFRRDRDPLATEPKPDPPTRVA